MQADAFWKNYMAAQEWQKRHNVTWWKSRCFALECENKILRNKLKELAHCSQSHTAPENTEENGNKWGKEINEENTMEDEARFEEDDDLEFYVNEDMMSFLEQSIRHKRELQEKRQSELATLTENEKLENNFLVGGTAWAQARNNNAKLLYGEASPRILAMEAALQATVDRHKDQAKPQYWPNIPLKL